MTAVGRWLVVTGLLIALVGGVVFVVGKWFGGGRLPGDIVYKSDNITIVAPLATMLLVSVILTVLLNVLLRLFR